MDPSLIAYASFIQTVNLAFFCFQCLCLLIWPGNVWYNPAIIWPEGNLYNMALPSYMKAISVIQLWPLIWRKCQWYGTALIWLGNVSYESGLAWPEGNICDIAQTSYMKAMSDMALAYYDLFVQIVNYSNLPR